MLVRMVCIVTSLGTHDTNRLNSLRDVNVHGHNQAVTDQTQTVARLFTEHSSFRLAQGLASG